MGCRLGGYGAAVRGCALAAALLWSPVGSWGASVPAELSRRVGAGEAVDVIVEYNAQAVDRDLATRRARLPRGMADDTLLDAARTRYGQLKGDADRRTRHPDVATLRDFSHLPMRLERVRSAAGLAALAAHPDVLAVYENGVLQRVLAQSLPLIGEPTALAAGYGGAGRTVAVIDDGIDLTNAAFGCTAVGTPAGCKIVANQTIAATPGTDFSHGTNVSATVLGVAPQAQVAMLNVFSSSGATFADVVAGINWAISNRSAYNIVAINMSLGDGTRNTSTCSSGNTFTTPVANARAAGISVVAAAGNSAYNNGAFVAGIGKPACTAGVVSVGAVYDSNLGGLVWGSAPTQCTDSTSQADQVTCFSQSASILTMLAPGALITAAGITEGGTSQASPHVAGAVAVLRSAYAADSLTTSETRLTTSSVQITDPRNGVTKPRLMLSYAARPANDDFVNRVPLAGTSGSTTGANLLATHEGAEPVHAAAGSQSVWWRWTAPASGQVTLTTAGSDFDSLLGAYTGSAVGALTAVASNDNSGASTTAAVVFQAQSGTTYAWAVDGANGSAGHVALQWSLNTSAQANLAATLSGPASAADGSVASFVLGVSNAGLQSATAVRATLTLPSGITYASGPGACIASGSTVTCSVAELASGGSTSWALLLNAVSLGSGVTLSASVTADTPDPSSANNSASAALSPPVTVVDSADVPVLPPGAMAALALLLAALSVHARRRAGG